MIFKGTDAVFENAQAGDAEVNSKRSVLILGDRQNALVVASLVLAKEIVIQLADPISVGITRRIALERSVQLLCIRLYIHSIQIFSRSRE